MRIQAFTVSLLLLASSASGNSVENEVKQSLELWEPVSVQHQGEVLIVTSKEQRITDQIYRAMIGGICMGRIVRPNSLDGVSKIRVMNQFSRQGYVFEGGATACDEINNMPVNRTEIHILGLTHMHTN